MNLLKVIRFFIFGPGAILTVIGIVIGVAGVIHQGQERQRLEAEKRQVQRPLGQVKPNDSVDKSTAPKEVILSNKRLVPGSTYEQPARVQAQAIAVPNAPSQRPLPQLVSFYAQVPGSSAASPTLAPEAARKDPSAWLPPSIFIPCALVNTVESSHINTPVVGEVLRDVYQNGHLIIPAGAIISSFAESGAVRDRIEVAGVWMIVYPDGRHLRVHGIACDREADPSNQQFGIEDGSAGLQGELIESDHYANAKAFLGILVASVAQAGQTAVGSVLQPSHSAQINYQLPDATGVIAKYTDQLLNGENGDGRFVRVRASKEFYVFVTETIIPGSRSIMEQRSPEDETALKSVPSENDEIVQEATKMERAIQNAAQPQERMRIRSLAISLAVVSLAGCATSPESVTTEHKGKVVIVHHRRRTSNGLLDKIEAINPSGVVTQAEVHVYDIGRLPYGDNGVDEAHRYYRIVQSQRPNLMLPLGTHPTGPRTVYTPPNYVPAPKDQRINDAVAEAKRAKEKLEAAAKQVQDRLNEDNNLRGELQAQIDENQRLQDQINAGMNTPKHTEKAPTQTDAEKAAAAAVDPLVSWGQQLQQ